MDYTISRFPSTTIKQNDSSTSRALCIVNKLFKTRADKYIDDGYPIDFSLVHRDKKELRNINSKLSA